MLLRANSIGGKGEWIKIKILTVNNVTVTYMNLRNYKFKTFSNYIISYTEFRK